MSNERSVLRIASLVPSLTELLVDLGLRKHIVARTGFCIHPADLVRDIPKLGGTKDVRIDRLRGLAPTHVLVNVDENRLELVHELQGWPAEQRPNLVVTHPSGPADVPALIDALVARFASPQWLSEEECEQVRVRGSRLRAAIERELDATQPGQRKPCRVLYLIWRDPWMTVARDTYIARMLARIDWLTLPEAEGGPSGAARYPRLDGNEAWLAEVEQVLLSSEPYRFDAGHIAEAQRLCPRAQVSLIDGEALSWYGPRTVDGLRLLRRLGDARGH